MTSFDQFHFLRPLWLLALIPLFVMIWLMVKKRLGSRSWEMVCDDTLLPYILTGTSVKRIRVSVFMTAIGGLLTIFALAGPVWEKLPQPVFTRESSLVIALDMSRSMDANDISPSRLLRARYKIADILKHRTDGQTALLVYAGDSFTVTPLTDDAETIASQLNALTTDIMPVQGNNTQRALARAADLLKNAGVTEGDILLITDEIDYDNTSEYVTELHDQGYRVSLLGVGTSQGVPIPLSNGSFLKDSNGKIVVPILDEKPMRMLADDGGGIYLRIDLGDDDIEKLFAYLERYEIDDEVASTDLKTDTWREQGPWLLIGLLPLMALMFRRGYLAVLFLIILPVPEHVQAMDWDSLWLRPDQQASRAFDDGDTARAAELFDDPAWKGSAQYKNGDFESAVKTLEQIDNPESIYNMGNALARLGNYEEAIAAYEEVLKRMPDHEDAQYNKELLEKELEKQQQQNQQQSKVNPEQDEEQKQDQEQNDQQQAQNEENQQESSKSEQQNNQQQDQQLQKEQQQQQAQQDKDEESKSEQAQQQLARNELPRPDEDQQATEQWLRRIPDDPAGLLRRKFRYQYQQRANERPAPDKTW